MRKVFITEIITSLFILLFVYAATSKLLDYQKFKIQLGQSPMLTSFSGFVSWFIPLLEIFIAISLAINPLRNIGLYASLFLMSLFTGYIITITNFSEYVPCSCGGVLQHMSWNQHMVFNIAFILLAITAIFLQANQQHKVIEKSI